MSDQPLPRPGGEDVTPIAREHFMTLLTEREQRGIVTYGRTLQTHNGRDCHRDLAEELVDAFQYATQAMLERRDLEAERDRLRADLDECRNQLGGADAESRWSMEQRRAAEQRVAEAEGLAEHLTARIIETAAPLMAGYVNADDAFACLAALDEFWARVLAVARRLRAARDELTATTVGSGAMGPVTDAYVAAFIAGRDLLLALAEEAGDADAE